MFWLKSLASLRAGAERSSFGDDYSSLKKQQHRKPRRLVKALVDQTVRFLHRTNKKSESTYVLPSSPNPQDWCPLNFTLPLALKEDSRATDDRVPMLDFMTTNSIQLLSPVSPALVVIDTPSNRTIVVPVANDNLKLAPPYPRSSRVPLHAMPSSEMTVVVALLFGLALILHSMLLQRTRGAGLKEKVKWRQRDYTSSKGLGDNKNNSSISNEFALHENPAPLTSLTASLSRSLFSSSPFKTYRVPSKMANCSQGDERSFSSNTTTTTTTTGECSCAQDATSKKIIKYQSRDLVEFCSRTMVQYDDHRQAVLQELLQRVRGNCNVCNPHHKRKTNFLQTLLPVGLQPHPSHLDASSNPTTPSNGQSRNTPSPTASCYSSLASSILTHNRFFPAMVSAFANAKQQQ